MLDVAACTQEILRREPPGTIRIISRKLGIKPRQVKDLACLISACHDIGKASPGFQMKWPGFSSAVSGQHFHLPRIPNCEINHAYASQLALKAWLRRQSVTEPIASVLSMAAGCHHGTRPSSHELSPGPRNGPFGSRSTMVMFIDGPSLSWWSRMDHGPYPEHPVFSRLAAPTALFTGTSATADHDPTCTVRTPVANSASPTLERP